MMLEGVEAASSATATAISEWLDASGISASATTTMMDSLSFLEQCLCWNETTSSSSSSSSGLNTLATGLLNHRILGDSDDEEAPIPVWYTVVVAITLAIMLLVMMLEVVGPDWAMVSALLLFLVCEIITIKEGLAGFANEGVLTVMALFVVAEGVSRTGALDYYMGKLLGHPKTVAGAQIRLMVPIAILSAFLNNTPIVAIMIPLTLRWAKKIGVPKQQLLIPLSYATILGGTCTLVGTSTNLVVSGLLQDAYPDEASGNIGLFDVAIYGVPNAMIGIAYMLACAPFLLPRGQRGGGSTAVDELLFGARVQPWSPAAGRTYKRSGLGDSGGIFLVNVRRAATGNVVTAVSKDFVISVGDELYFTGSVEQFGEFCEKHGLEIITTENIHHTSHATENVYDDYEIDNTLAANGKFVDVDVAVDLNHPGGGIGGDGSAATPQSIKQKELENVRIIRHLSDQIGGREPASFDTGKSTRPAKVTVALDETEQAVLIGVDSQDRPGLLVLIASALSDQGLNIRHSEAKVIGERSLSVWRCEPHHHHHSSSSPSQQRIDLEEIWAATHSLLQSSSMSTDLAIISDTAALKKTTGTRVVRAIVTQCSTLIGKKPIDVEFRKTYMASIVAYQKNNKNYMLDVEMGAGDLLVLETLEGSPLLTQPPQNFYEKLQRSAASRRSFLNRNKSTAEDFSNSAVEDSTAGGGDIEGDLGARLVWKDLKVIFDVDQNVPKGEFLTAFVVNSNDSPLVGKSVNELNYTRLPGVVLISVERPRENNGKSSSQLADVISLDTPLQVGDILWYSGSAEAIADMQKVQGLVFYHDEQMKETPVAVLTERRLVQAVVAKGSPLVGQTVKDVHFRSAYGGAVISIQRGSERVHELPANVKLQTGDVLLIEAGPSFVEKHGANYRTFALVAEVENSAPPRPRLFLLCAAMMIAMLAIAGVELRSLLITAGLVGVVMVSLRIVTQQEARDALQWDIYVTVAAAFGIGTAMGNSGVAQGIATFLVYIGQAIGIGNAGVYGAVYLACNLLSAILTNNAAAALMFPIAMNAVDQTGADRLKMSMVLMLSASDYITSFGYQCNLMVYGPGEYANVDFFKFGAPMQVLLWLSSTAMVSTLSIDNPKWVISWIICLAGFLVVAAFRLTGGLFGRKKNEEDLKDVSSWQLATPRNNEEEIQL